MARRMEAVVDSANGWLSITRNSGPPISFNLLEPARYVCRAGPFAGKTTYTIDKSSLRWICGRRRGSIEFCDIAQVSIKRGRDRRAPARKAVAFVNIVCRSGTTMTISPLHLIRLGVWQDKSVGLSNFLGVLLSEIRSANLIVPVIVDHRRHKMVDRIVVSVESAAIIGLLRIVRMFGGSASRQLPALQCGRLARCCVAIASHAPI